MGVLVVDDSKMNREVMGRKFETSDFKNLAWTVEHADSGEKALEMTEKGGVFDVIVMD